MSLATSSIEGGAKRAEENHATLASRVYGQLRREIITGRHAPGRKLRIQSLCTQFGVGLSPMREALTRLSRDGLVRHEDQRGFSVAPLDQAHLEELTRTRCWFNEIGLRESIAHGDQRWEEGVLLAYHRLSKIPRYLSDDGVSVFNPVWEEAHRVFHSSLIAACGSRWLIDYCEQLFDASDFYRHVSRVSLLRRKQRENEHERIVKATLARDADTAIGLLTAHLRHTAELVRERLAVEARG
jgi:DNA-binding GntR family transcriptional regulator